MGIPQHVAIIMDGNGRWAEQRRRPRPFGHRAGAEAVDALVPICVHLGIRYLTLFAFSTENWNRPQREVGLLMRLLVDQLRKMEAKLKKNRVSLLAQGSLEKLPESVRAELARVIASTHLPDPSLRLTLCLSYGGRREIVDAALRMAEDLRQGLIAAPVDEADFRRYLYTPEIPDPDLLIRTGGEFRVSNFLLWQCAYSELYVTQTLWPDFGESELRAACEEFGRRQRRFGLTPAQAAPVRAQLHEGAL